MIRIVDTAQKLECGWLNGAHDAFRAQGVQGQLDAMGTVATARAGSMSAFGGLAGNIAGLGSTGYDFYRQGAFRGLGWGPKTTTAA